MWAERLHKIMATRKRHSPEQIVRKLMAADRPLAEGKDNARYAASIACPEPHYDRADSLAVTVLGPTMAIGPRCGVTGTAQLQRGHQPRRGVASTGFRTQTAMGATGLTERRGRHRVGRNERVTPPRQARRAQNLFPDASMHWSAHCAHFPCWDLPGQAAHLILTATQADTPRPTNRDETTPLNRRTNEALRTSRLKR